MMVDAISIMFCMMLGAILKKKILKPLTDIDNSNENVRFRSHDGNDDGAVPSQSCSIRMSDNDDNDGDITTTDDDDDDDESVK